MKFTPDHDYHIHSQLSSCSNDPEQTAENILRISKESGFTSICLTDHFWDETIPGASHWYMPQNLPHIKEALPLPVDEEGKVKFFFGCETDMDMHGTIGISHKVCEMMDFIIVPTTHLHMPGFTIDASIGGGEDESFIRYRADQYVKRFQILLDADLPFEKTGVAHLTCGLICAKPSGSNSYLRVLNLVPDETYRELFTQSAKKGLKIELNFGTGNLEGQDLENAIRPYKIAKECGCLFYLGSDAHHPGNNLSAKKKFEHMIDLLDLTEDMKFVL